jgi:hypothetical protein
MFIGGNVEGRGDPADEASFYAGYGAVEVEGAALAYYRYERIIADVVDYCRQAWEGPGLPARVQGLRGYHSPGRLELQAREHSGGRPPELRTGDGEPPGVQRTGG